MRWMVGLLAGCNSILGVHDFGAPDAGTGGPSRTVTVQLIHRAVINTASFTAALEDAPLAVDRVTLDDGTPLTFTSDGSGATFQAPAGASYRVGFGGVFTLDSDLDDVRYALIGYGDPAHALTAAGTMIKAQIEPKSSSGALALVSTGVPSTTPLQPDNYGQLVPWTAPYVLGSAFDDRIYAAYFAPMNNGNGSLLQEIADTSIDMVNGGTTTVTLNMQPVQRTLGNKISVPFSADLARLRAAGGQDLEDAAGTWAIAAMYPAIEHHNTQLLASGTATTDIALDLQYGNPYPQASSVLMEIAYVGDAAHGPAINRMTPLEPNADGTLTQDVGILGPPMIDGAAIAPNLAIDASKPVVVTWSLASPGPVDLAQVNLFDDTLGRVVAAVITARAQAAFDGGLFVPGHSYSLGFVLDAGLPMAASGDYQTIAPAYAQALLRTASFVVGQG